MKSFFLLVSTTVFCSVFLIHLFLWSQWGLIDSRLWAQRIEHFQTELANQQFDVQDPVYSGHPGMPIITTGAILQTITSASTSTLIPIITSLFTAAAITGVYIITYILRPNTPWWALATLFATMHPLLAGSTPTNAVVAPLITLFILLTLLLYERSTSLHRWAPYLAGIVLGAAATTRLPTTAILAAPFIILLATTKKPTSQLIPLFTSAIATSLILDPFLLISPLQHIQYMLFRTNLNYTEYVDMHQLGFSTIVSALPLSLLSALLALALVTTYFSAHNTVPTQYIYALFAATILLFIGILSVRNQQIRYFMPIAYMWDTFLPLFLFSITKQQRFFLLRPAPILALATLMHTGLFIYILFLPSI